MAGTITPKSDGEVPTAPIEDSELPIVARMVVEIRSDGTRTVARGAIEDSLSGEQVGVEARADSPLELSRALAKLLLSAPLTALVGRGRPDAAGGDRRRSGVRGVVGALGRKVGQKLGEGLERRLGLGSRDDD